MTALPASIVDPNWRRRPRVWTPARLWRLAELMERDWDDERIAAALGTTPAAIKLARKRHKLRPISKQLLTARQVAELLGVRCSKTVARWIQLGYLCAKRGPAIGLHRMYLVERADLDAFMADRAYWHLWEPARLADPWLRQHYTAARQGERFLTLTEVAERCYVERGTVASWLDKGVLPFVRNCRNNRFVPSSALEGFVPPGLRSKLGRRRRGNAEQDARISALRATGLCWSEIGRAVGLPRRTAAQRWYRLNKERGQ